MIIGAAIEDDPESIVYNTLMFFYLCVGIYCLVSSGLLNDASVSRLVKIRPSFDGRS